MRACIALLLPLGWAHEPVQAAPPQGDARAESSPSKDAPTLLLLPIQDRAGEPLLARLVEESLRATLGRRHALPDNRVVRDLMREQRLRDPRNLRPSLVAGLAKSVGAEETLVVSLLSASDREVPTITISAQSLRSGEIEIGWAGFVSRDGLDAERSLGRGRVEDLAELASQAGAELAEAFLELRGPNAGSSPPIETVYRRRALSFSELGPAVVVPFRATLRRNAGPAAQVATDLALATLDGLGARILWPGALHELLINKPDPSIGEVLPTDRALIRSALGARSLLTGNVERRELGGSVDRPEPETGFGARLVDAETGEILWTSGVSVGGWDQPGLFGVSRIYGLDSLSRDALVTLFSSIEGPATRRTAAHLEHP